MDSTEDTESARPDSVDEVDQPHPDQQPPETQHPKTQQQRPPVSDDPAMPDRFRDAVCALDDIDQRPVADHAETYDAVHRDLRTVLDDVEKHS